MLADFFDLRLVLIFGFSQMLGEFLRPAPCARFRFSPDGRELLHLGFVLLFGLRKMRAEFLDFGFVASFGLRKELAVELLNLREPLWNEGI